MRIAVPGAPGWATADDSGNLPLTEAPFQKVLVVGVDAVTIHPQLEFLRAPMRAGSVAAAAYELGISETTVRQHRSAMYRRMGCLDAARAPSWRGTRRPGPDVARSDPTGRGR